MTMPHERARALIWAGGFLVELYRDPRTPGDIRCKAAVIARHFPTIEQVLEDPADLEASVPGLNLDAEVERWKGQLVHGPLTFNTRLR